MNLGLRIRYHPQRYLMYIQIPPYRKKFQIWNTQEYYIRGSQSIFVQTTFLNACINLVQQVPKWILLFKTLKVKIPRKAGPSRVSNWMTHLLLNQICIIRISFLVVLETIFKRLCRLRKDYKNLHIYTRRGCIKVSFTWGWWLKI